MDSAVKPHEEEEFSDSSSDSSILSEDWQDLTKWPELMKSDFAKVIFCDMNYDAENNTVGCKFQITDNVHEDPCDYVGLFKIGKSQCFVSKMLSETECEEDGKLLRCNFSDNGLPDGFYHFQYVTRDGEVCGASTPVEIKRLPLKEESLDKKLAVEMWGEKNTFLQSEPKEDSSDEDVVTENAENDFVVVEHILVKKNRMLEDLLEKFRAKNLALTSDMEVLLEAKSKLCQEKEEVIELLHKEILSLKAEFTRKETIIMERDNEIKSLCVQLHDSEQTIVRCREDLDTTVKLLGKCEEDKSGLHNEVQLLKEIIQLKQSIPTEPEKSVLLEQLDDQTFMIRALEDSKQLALKEMSDLSESLSKRTKVLNQTRSELASCKLKLKESDSVVEKQKVHIGKLVKKVEDLNSFEKVRQHAACRNKDDIDLSKPVQELYEIAIARSEKFLSLVDTLVAKTDFHNYFQEKSFHRLKIMFFVLLGKMKKPRHLMRSRDGSPNSSPERNDVKKPVSRMLPSHKGYTSTGSLDNNNTNPIVEAVQGEGKTTHINMPKAGDPSGASSGISTSSMQYLSHDHHKLRCKQINEILKAGIPNVNDEDLTFFKELWNGYNERPKCILEESAITEFEVNDPLTVLMTPATRKEMKRLEGVFEVIEHEILTNGKQSPVNEFFLEVLRASIKIEILLGYMEKVYKEASSEEKEELKKKCEESNIEAANLTKDVVNLKDEVNNLSSKLLEAGASELNLKAEIAKKEDVITCISEHKESLMEREVALHAIVKEHEARIKEAAELYKTMYLEMDKLKKKLRRAKVSKTKAVGQESSTVEDAYPFQSRELYEVPLKRARKMTLKSASPKSAEKATGSKAVDQQPQVAKVKAADKQPQMLKEISLKSISQNAEKAYSKSGKKAAFLKACKKSTAADAMLSYTLESIRRTGGRSGIPSNGCPDFASLQRRFECILPEVAKDSGNTFPDLPKCVPPSKQPRKTTPTKCAKATRCVSDSDTGEHVLRNTAVPIFEGDKPLEKKQKPIADDSKIFEAFCDEKRIFSPITESLWTNLVMDDKPSSPVLDVSLEPGNRDLRSVHTLLKNELTKASSPATQNDDKFYDIPCVLCDKSLRVTEDLANLMDHLESEHQISMCPICGVLFEAAFPKKYLLFHVEDHFKSE